MNKESAGYNDTHLNRAKFTHSFTVYIIHAHAQSV